LGLTLLGVFALLAVDVAFADAPGGLEAKLYWLTREILDEIERQSGAPLPDAVEAVAGALPSWVFGAVVAIGLLNIAANGILAQSALTRLGWNRVAAPPLSSLSLPRATSLVFFAAVLAGQYGVGQVRFLGINLAEVLAVPLLLGGLAVLHMAVKRHPARLLLLTAAYLAVIFLGLIVIVMIVGVIEQWVGLRRRMPGYAASGDQ
jgi:uncharacterized protein YybS (DUF2232 family)